MQRTRISSVSSDSDMHRPSAENPRCSWIAALRRAVGYAPLVKPWLEKALAWTLIAFVVLALIWFALDSKGRSDVDARRERWALNGWPTDPAELLPPADAHPDATDAYSKAVHSLAYWDVNQAATGRAEHVIREVDCHWMDLESNPAQRPTLSAIEDDPAFEQMLTDIGQAVQAQSCRVFYTIDGQKPCAIGIGLLLPWCMEFRVKRDFLRDDRAAALDHLVDMFAYACRLREVPTVEFCSDSDACLLRAMQLLRIMAREGALDSATATRIRPWLARVDPHSDWIRAIDGERVLVGEPMWDRMRAGLIPYGVFTPRDSLGLLYTRLARPWRLMEEAKYFDLLDEKRELIVDSPWQKHAAPPIPGHMLMNRAIAKSFVTRSPPVTPISLDGETRLRVRRARDLAEIALRVVMLQAESGVCPDSLASLSDLPCEPPLCQPYSFTRTESGFTLGLSNPADDPDGTETWRIDFHRAR